MAFKIFGLGKTGKKLDRSTLDMLHVRSSQEVMISSCILKSIQKPSATKAIILLDLDDNDALLSNQVQIIFYDDEDVLSTLEKQSARKLHREKEDVVLNIRAVCTRLGLDRTRSRLLPYTVSDSRSRIIQFDMQPIVEQSKSLPPRLKKPAAEQKKHELA